MQQHTDWLKSVIQATAAFPAKTFVTIAKVPVGETKIPAPYVVIHPADGINEQTRFTGPRSTQNPRFTIHTVGDTYAQVAAGAKQIKDKLVVNGLGITPTVPNENSRHVWYDSPIPIQVDNDVSPALIYHVAEVGWSSDPA